MCMVNRHQSNSVILFLLPFFIFCSNIQDKLSPSFQVRSDGFYYCIRPDNKNVLMVIQFFNDGRLRASQWIRTSGSIGEIAEVKDAANSWLKECEGFTMCTSYHCAGAKLEFDLDLANPASVFASGNPTHRKFSGKVLADGNVLLTWDYDDTRFSFTFIANNNRQPTSSDSLLQSRSSDSLHFSPVSSVAIKTSQQKGCSSP